MRINGLGDQPEFHLEVDQAKAGALGLSTANINDTLATAIGGIYVNDFVDRGRVKKVYLQADAPFRMQPGDLGQLVRAQLRRRHGADLGLCRPAPGA